MTEPRITVHRLHAWEMCGCDARHEPFDEDTHYTNDECGCPLPHEEPPVIEEPDG